MNFVFIALRSEANAYFAGRLVDKTSRGCGHVKLKFTWTFMVKFVNAVISQCDFWLLFPSNESGHFSRTVSAERRLRNETICRTTSALSDSVLSTRAVPWFAGHKAIHLLHYSTATPYVWCGQSLDLCSRLNGWWTLATRQDPCVMSRQVSASTLSSVVTDLIFTELNAIRWRHGHVCERGNATIALRQQAMYSVPCSDYSVFHKTQFHVSLSYSARKLIIYYWLMIRVR